MKKKIVYTTPQIDIAIFEDWCSDPHAFSGSNDFSAPQRIEKGSPVRRLYV